MALDVTPLSNSIARLEEGVALYRQDKQHTIIRDGLIQRFEFTYEISHKTLRRALQALSASPADYDSMNFPDLIRSGSKAGLLYLGWPSWKQFRDMRSITSHTYDERQAMKVVEGIPGFLLEVIFLRDQLIKKTL